MPQSCVGQATDDDGQRPKLDVSDVGPAQRQDVRLKYPPPHKRVLNSTLRARRAISARGALVYFSVARSY